MAETSVQGEGDPQRQVEVVYKFRDIQESMVDAWISVFADKPYYNTRIEVSKGDIFKAAPSADAVVSPANSFGFMDGGIDNALSLHFGWTMSERLRRIIATEKGGELLVGEALIVATNVKGEADPVVHADTNEGTPIPWLISAPTMRVPHDVSHTMNAYLAFRAVIRSVEDFNRRTDVEPIRSVLCPGLGTAVGRMPPMKCARQMLRAFETVDLKIHPGDIKPVSLKEPWNLHLDLVKKA